jgi:hypothetical protein
MTVAATIDPTPNSSVTVVIEEVTAAVVRPLVSRSWVSKASQVGDELEFIAGRRHQTTPGGVRGKVTVTLRPHLHHRPMIIGPNLTQIC